MKTILHTLPIATFLNHKLLVLRRSKKIILLLCLSLNCFHPFFSKGGEIPFEKGTFQDALKKAAATKKLIFVDAFTTWCGPCKWMAKNVFTQDEVAKFYESNFVCVKLDMEKGEGIEFAKKYEVSAFPTFLFIDGEGNKIHQVCGSKEAPAFIVDGQNALAPEKQLIGFQTRYVKGEREFNFLKEYGRMLTNANLSADNVIDELINSDAASELVNELDFDLISSGASLESNSFLFIMKHQEKYQSLMEKQKMKDFINGVFLTEVVKAARAGTPDKLAEAQIKAEELKVENVKELSLRMTWQYAQVSKQELFESAQPFIENFAMKDANELNNAAWIIFENYNEPDRLEIAEQWAKQAIELKRDFASTDTYANILHKLQKNEEALIAVKESIALGKKEEQDTADTEKLASEIQAALKAKK